MRLVKSNAFDYVMSCLILVNALTIGAQTNYAAANLTSEVPAEFAAIENLFCAVFTGELTLRLYTFRLSFFHRHGWKWNVFDFAVVGLQLLEVVFGGLPNLSFVRMVRVLRLVRAIRLIRVVRHIAELRTLVASFGNSLAPLFWALVLLMLLIYTVSLFITQLISDHRLANKADEERGVFHELDYYYGTLYRSMLSFFQAIAGGVDWDSLVAPLADHISVVLAPCFCLYVAFTLLAMMNVLTAVFVESVLESTKNDKDVFLINNVRELFKGVDGGVHDGIMDWATFQQKLDSRPMFEFFKAIDVDLSEAAGLFQLLDTDRDGSIDAEEFLSGCLRLRGPARALDLAMLIDQVRQIDLQLAPQR